METQIHPADYLNTVHARAIGDLLNHYAEDPIGGGEALPLHVRERVAGELAKRTNAFSFLAFQGECAVGLVNCFEGFSTFACQPLINVHDVVVTASARGQGISRKLLERVEQVARVRGCCLLMLEVLEDNESAKVAYRKAGFEQARFDARRGYMQLWCKPL
ncbi:GNAT family N-acetyltransferase [Pseudomonas sp. LS1212]|uniref:GNAT family N-acetyltransferase n=1 Tax=Pseudomonas sp. LS1212 TaxID=2972478 RepID=UPI00215CAF7D|nr:GNAT family N-acetyltransferase [Pseudomonas sp. LS1212]UVJ45843.1 GNAT family N-acetyltransferase [Pseudomonas sp. LS1212]